MLNTNRLGPPSSDQMTNIPKVDDLINKLDTGQFLPDQVTFVLCKAHKLCESTFPIRPHGAMLFKLFYRLP